MRCVCLLEGKSAEKREAAQEIHVPMPSFFLLCGSCRPLLQPRSITCYFYNTCFDVNNIGLSHLSWAGRDQWCPGHLGIFGNEKADCAAKQNAAAAPQGQQPPLEILRAVSLVARNRRKKTTASSSSGTTEQGMRQNTTSS